VAGLDVLHLFKGLFMFTVISGKEIFHGVEVGVLTFLDLVQLVFHFCSKAHVKNIGIVFYKQSVYIPAEFSRHERPVFDYNVAPVLNGRDNGCISARSAYAFFLEFLYKACFVVFSGWLGEMLRGSNRYDLELVSFLEAFRQNALILFVL